MKVRVIDKPCLFAETVYLLYYYINGIAYTRDYERVNRKFGRYLLEKEDQGLQLAQELDLPVSVHDREAHAEMYELLRKYKPRGALHCYSGSADDAAWLVEQGMYLGFGGAVTYKGAKRAARVLAAIPHDRALLETDCPYMAPEPVRGTRNDSRNIVHVAVYIGTLWDMDAQDVLDQTAANARACFGV